jgi:hypothetical protein
VGDVVTAAGRWWEQAWLRLQPDAVPGGLGTSALVVLVTVVHELGHGLVGVLCGRRFTGLVLRGDMSGHAVTVGPARGPGRVLSTWAGYPAPAVVGAASVQAAHAGWAPTLLAATAVVLLLSLVRVRSWYTAAVMVAVTAVAGALWWWGAGPVQAAVVLGTGTFLVVGAWRHLGAVLSRPSPSSDPSVLAQLTWLPRWGWILSFAVALAAATWWALAPLRELAAGLVG